MDDSTPTSPSLADWRAQVERDLKGARFERRLIKHTADGIPVAPLYTAADATRPIPRAAAGWTPLAHARHPDPRIANAHLKTDLARGADAVLVDVGGVEITDARDLEALLDGVDAPVHMIGGHLLHAAALAEHDAAASLGLDPVGHLARVGGISSEALELSARLAMKVYERPVRVFEVDTRPYHAAGAGEALCLGLGLATGVGYLQALVDAGFTVDEAAARIGFTVDVGVRFFESVAAIRALRVAWSRIIEASGGSDPALRVRAWPAERQFSRRDPFVNMLRNTAAVFAGAVGGAEQVVSAAFDGSLGEPTGLGRRVARNTQTILARESHLAAVADPAGGSWYIETLTTQIAEKAWTIFQAVEASGGIFAALVTGRVQAQIEAQATQRAERIATRRQPITGVSAFADDDALRAAEPLDRAALAAWRATRTAPAVTVQPGDLDQAIKHVAAGARFDDLLPALDDGRVVGAAPMPVRRDAAPFEALRDQADAGPRPAVFLANLGPVARHIGRATFATNLLRAGGLTVLGNDGFGSVDALVEAFAASGAEIACVCGHEDDYATDAAASIAALRAAGAHTIVMAGKPRGLPVDHFVHLRCDALAVLSALLTPR